MFVIPEHGDSLSDCAIVRRSFWHFPIAEYLSTYQRAHSLVQLTRKGVPFEFSEPQLKAMEDLKQAFIGVTSFASDRL